MEEILYKTERFNLDAQSLSKEDKDKSVSYLLGSLEKRDTLLPIAKLIEVYSVADCLAQARQKQRLLSLKSITILSFFAIIAQQIYVGLYINLSWFVIHIVLVAAVIIIALAFISSALLKTFSAQMGYEELSQRYLRTGYFFQQAMSRMALIDMQLLDTQSNYIRLYQNVIKTIGIEALNENAAWLQLHKMNAYQVQVS